MGDKLAVLVSRFIDENELRAFRNAMLRRTFGLETLRNGIINTTIQTQKIIYVVCICVLKVPDLNVGRYIRCSDPCIS
jgi:hypothetical protein